MKYDPPASVLVLRLLSAFAVIFSAGMLIGWINGNAALIGVAAVAGAFAATCFVTSVIVDLLGRSAFHSERAADALVKLASGSIETTAGSGTFYISRDGKTQGPISGAMVRQLIESGAVTSDTPAMKKGDSEWQTVGAILGSN